MAAKKRRKVAGGENLQLNPPIYLSYNSELTEIDDWHGRWTVMKGGMPLNTPASRGRIITFVNRDLGLPVLELPVYMGVEQKWVKNMSAVKDEE
jgi:hypothetical protein